MCLSYSMAIELNTVEETLFIPAWCRAQRKNTRQSSTIKQRLN